MENLAGYAAADSVIEEELFTVGIEPCYGPRSTGEVATRVTGKMEAADGTVFTFIRAWRYWIVKGELPLFVAQELYKHPYGKRCRAGGDCTSPPPETQATYRHTMDGRKVEILNDSTRENFRKLDQGEIESEFFAEVLTKVRKEILYVDSVEERNKLSTFGYVDTYHVDTLAGLKLFVDTIKDLPDDWGLR